MTLTHLVGHLQSRAVLVFIEVWQGDAPIVAQGFQSSGILVQGVNWHRFSV